MQNLFMWGLVLLLAVLALLIGIGKGDWLIAGYNTASSKERARYNIRTLRKIMSISLCLLALCIAAMSLPILRESGFYKFSYIFILIISIVTLILANTIAKNKEPVTIIETTEDKRKQKRTTRISLIIAAVILIFVAFSLFTGNISYQISDHILHITTGDWKDLDISLNDIESVSMEEDIALGRRTFGVGNFKIRGGDFKNDTFGKYTLYSFNSCKSYVVLKADEQYYVLNKSTELETEELYQSLLQYIEAK